MSCESWKMVRNLTVVDDVYYQKKKKWYWCPFRVMMKRLLAQTGLNAGELWACFCCSIQLRRMISIRLKKKKNHLILETKISFRNILKHIIGQIIEYFLKPNMYHQRENIIIFLPLMIYGQFLKLKKIMIWRSGVVFGLDKNMFFEIKKI